MTILTKYIKQPAAREYVIQALAERGPLTCRHISELTGCGYAGVRRAVEIMRARGELHVKGHALTKRRFAMVLALGPGKDAPVPVIVPAPRKSRAAPKKPKVPVAKRVRESRRKPSVVAPATETKTKFVGANPWAGLLP